MLLFQKVQKAREAVAGRLPSLRVERQGRVLVIDGERALNQDAALVHATLDPVPGDAVLRFSRDLRPHWRVQPGVARQRTVMEVYGAAAALAQHRLRQDVEVGDAQQPVGLATGDRECLVGEVGHHCRERLGERRQLRRQAERRARSRTAPHLAPDRDEPPGFDVSECRDRVRRFRLERVEPAGQRTGIPDRRAARRPPSQA